MTINILNTLPQHMRPMLVRSASEPMKTTAPVEVQQKAADTTVVEVCTPEESVIRPALPVAVLAQIRLRPCTTISAPIVEERSIVEEREEHIVDSDADNTPVVEEEVPPQMCLICYTEFTPRQDPMYIYHGCHSPGHTYCPTCIVATMRSYLTLDTIQRVARCPGGSSCSGTLSDEQLEHILGDEFHKIRRFQLERTATVWCSDPSCASPLEGTRRKGRCVDCPRLTCMKCGRRYHRGLCLPKVPSVGAGFHAAIHGAQQCKECHRWIIKNGGCDHMTCRSCGYEFCWLCKQDWRGHKDKWCIVKVVPNTMHRFTGPAHVKPITVPLATAAAGVAVGVAGAAATVAAAGAVVVGTGYGLVQGGRGVARGVRKAYRSRFPPKRPDLQCDINYGGGIGELSEARRCQLRGTENIIMHALEVQ